MSNSRGAIWNYCLHRTSEDKSDDGRSDEQHNLPAVNTVTSVSYGSLPSIKQADYLREYDYSCALGHFSSNFPAKGPLVFPAKTTQKSPKGCKYPALGIFKSLQMNSR